jgi:predicted O-methyltransferase YrrM
MKLTEASPVLREMLATGHTLEPDGTRVPYTGGVNPAYAEALYQQVLRQQPRTVVEIGMAHGVSSLAILTALEQNGGAGRLLSIDPYQGVMWKFRGCHAVARAGLAHRHHHYEEADWAALPRLLAEGVKVDLGYIDGSHAFDYTLLDSFYLDKMMPVGGVMAFNDCGFEAVDDVLKYFRVYRRYAEVDVGLPFVRGRPFGLGAALRDPSKLPAAAAALTPATFRSLFRAHQDRYFRKLESWEPSADIPPSF